MHTYFSGIGGVGIGPLAEIAADAGYEVHGSDMSQSLVTDELTKRNIPIAIDQSGDFLQSVHQQLPVDWFVHTAALPESHPELVLAKKLGIKTAKRDELLAHIIADKNLKLIAVAGTHGKTTTTGMMTWALKKLGAEVSYSIGTTLSWGPSGKFDPKSQYFVYECDEFDRNFLHFSPFLSLITSVEYDHPDTYPTEAEYFAAFSQFIKASDHTIAWNRDISDISTVDNSWQLADDEVMPLDLAGQHNRRNATLVVKALEYLEIGDVDSRREAVASFPGTNRRMEKLAENLYSDYGHTPTEIAATLQLASELSSDVVLVYQPHQNIRQHEILDQYNDGVFAKAREVYWLPTYLSRENPDLAVLSPADLTANLSGIQLAEMDDELWGNIQNHRDSGALVLAMGAGSIDGWLRQNLSN